LSDAVVALIARTLEPGRALAWHGGPTPPGALRGVAAALARWRPPRGGHTIWELALHIAYWNYMIRKRILGTAVLRFPRSPANWPAMPKRADDSAWAADCALVAEQHRLLLEVVQGFPASRLGRRMGPRKRWSYGDTILGITVHDAYHVGQIQLLKRIGKHS
jgi:DinB family protein